jgi:hypothetical protein
MNFKPDKALPWSLPVRRKNPAENTYNLLILIDFYRLSPGGRDRFFKRSAEKSERGN